MAKKSYGDWIRSNPPLPTKEYQKKHMDERDYKAMNDELKREHHIVGVNKMVTAVEWFSSEIFNQFELLKRGIINDEEFRNGLLNKRDQAKQMEKEHIVNAHLTGLIYPLETDASLQAEEYYEQTFKK